MILPIKKWPDPILLKPCAPWNFQDPPLGLQRFIAQDLIDTLEHEHALGLAANQVGIGYRVMAMAVQQHQEKIVLFNPEVVSVSEELWEHPEGCLSFPRVELTIARPRYVQARWFDLTGKQYEEIFQEIDAKCFLHELDHLNGRVFKEYVSNLKFERAVTKSRK
jgi:peptide deformylase